MLYIVADGDGQLSYTGALAGRLGGTVYPALRRLKQQELPQIRGGTARYLQNGVSPRRYKN